MLNSKKIFYIFLTIHTLLWTCVLYFARNVLPFDPMEAVSWGELIDFGTNKHPPLSGWLAAGFYDFLGQHDIFLYFLGQICILICFIYVYKLAKQFIDEEKAFCSAMILESCTYYTFFVFRDVYNCNILLFAFWPIIVYYFYQACKTDSLKSWLIFGLTSGLAFLGKYQIVFLFVGMFIYLIFENREQFKKKGMYLAILTGSLVILPHVIWLFKTDFFSFAYMLERTESETHNMPVILEHFTRILYPLKFVIGQVLACVGCIVIFLLTALNAKNLNVAKLNKNGKFLFYIFFTPIIAQGLMGLITGNRVPSVWGSIMVSLAGIMLFYFFPVNFKEKTFKYFSVLVFSVMFCIVSGIMLYSKIQTDNLVSFPESIVMQDFENIMGETPLKYVGGDAYYTFLFRIYHNNKPRAVLNTYGAENIWINKNDIEKSGMLMIETKPESLSKGGYEPQEYSYNICNAFNKCDNYKFYYTVIRPSAN